MQISCCYNLQLRADKGKSEEDNFPKAGGGYGKVFSDEADPIKSPSAQHGGIDENLSIVVGACNLATPNYLFPTHQ